MTAMALLKRIGWLALGCAVVSGCKKPPTPRCDPSQSGRDPSQAPDVAQCGGPNGGVCDPIVAICTWPCLTDGDCTTRGLDGKRWLCSDGLCRDFAKDSAVDMAQAGSRADYCRKNSDCPDSSVCDAYGQIQPIPFGTDPAAVGKVPYDRAGRCIAKELVFYVHQDDGSCATGDGSQARPFCEITQALTAPLSDAMRRLQPLRRIIRVHGSERRYGDSDKPMDLRSDDALYLMGPGQRHDEVAANASWGAELAARLSGIAVGASQQVVLDGLYFEGIKGAATLDCQGTASVSIRRSYLTAPSGVATLIVGRTCTLSLDSDWFDGIQRQNGALQIEANATIRNCFFTRNTTSGLITLSPTGSASPGNIFEYNTLLGNQTEAGTKTIDCGTTGLSLAKSLLQDSPAGVSGACGASESMFNGSGTYLQPKPMPAVDRCPPYGFVSTGGLECDVDTMGNGRWDYYGRTRGSEGEMKARRLCFGAESAAQPPAPCQ